VTPSNGNARCPSSAHSGRNQIPRPGLVDPMNVDALLTARAANDESDRRAGHTEQVSHDGDRRLVGLAPIRRRGDCHLETLAVDAPHTRVPGLWLDLEIDVDPSPAFGDHNQRLRQRSIRAGPLPGAKLDRVDELPDFVA
jgi:hypothetical protein